MRAFITLNKNVRCKVCARCRCKVASDTLTFFLFWVLSNNYFFVIFLIILVRWVRYKGKNVLTILLYNHFTSFALICITLLIYIFPKTYNRSRPLNHHCMHRSYNNVFTDHEKLVNVCRCMQSGRLKFFFNASGSEHLIPDDILKGIFHEFVQFVWLTDANAKVISVSIRCD